MQFALKYIEKHTVLTCLAIHVFFYFDLGLHILGQTIPYLNARWVGMSGLDDSLLAPQFPHFRPGNSSF